MDCRLARAPNPGLTEVAPVAADGKRSEPAMSLPWASAPMPLITAEDAPPDEPPDDAQSFHGLKVRPCRGLSVVARMENSGVLVRPMMTAPARFRLLTTGESPGAMTSFSATRPLGVALPFWSMFSLIVIGTPCSGPTGPDRCIASSSRSASASASSPKASTTALRAPLPLVHAVHGCRHGLARGDLPVCDRPGQVTGAPLP